VAKKAAALGLTTRPVGQDQPGAGSQVVTEYLKAANLIEPLEKLGFFLVGYGCTTCIGNSGPGGRADRAGDQGQQPGGGGGPVGQSQLRGPHPPVGGGQLSGLAAAGGRLRAGRHDGHRLRSATRSARAPAARTSSCATSGRPAGGRAAHKAGLKDEIVPHPLRRRLQGTEEWRKLQIPSGMLFKWDDTSTYIRRPPYFDGMSAEPPGMATSAARARWPCSATRSPPTTSRRPDRSRRPAPAAKYLGEHGVAPADFNQYGARRGNHEVMVRGTFANIRLRNLLVPGVEGRRHGAPARRRADGDLRRGDALRRGEGPADRHRRQGVRHRLVARLGGQGDQLLGVRAVIAESYERIHRINLVGMGVLPLQFLPGAVARDDRADRARGLRDARHRRRLAPGKQLTVRGDRQDLPGGVPGRQPQEVEYLAHGGILPYV
jgi:aconitate hydratase